MFGNGFGRFRKRYRVLQSQICELEKELDFLENSLHSTKWKGYNYGPIKYYAERYANCEDTHEKERVLSVCEKLDSVIEEFDMFIENEYAPKVFDYYSVKKPKVTRISTDEVYGWEEAFGKSFEDLDKSLRHSLVGLVEEPGRYGFS
ncbi:MAG: hypothetical protein K6F51_05085 [Acetatifactor sp.]|nr:hypothetical protein [Acetatifactor sp.]